ncbi:MAG: hypothetical protein ABI867_44780 [Kofleriaceae bacterium]
MDLRIPTVAVAVRIAQSGKPELEAELFIAAESRHDRAQLLEDLATMLDTADTFVPVRANGVVRLVGKHALAWVAVHRRGAEATLSTDFPDEPSEVITLYDRQHRVELVLADGSITGLLLDSLPADHPRVLDYLNHAPRFVRLWTPEAHVFVNKQRILEVIELGSESAD